MSELRIGGTLIDTIGQLKVGSSNVTAAYVGSAKVFPSTTTTSTTTTTTTMAPTTTTTTIAPTTTTTTTTLAPTTTSTTTTTTTIEPTTTTTSTTTTTTTTVFSCTNCNNWEYSNTPAEGDIIYYYRCSDGAQQTLVVSGPGETGFFCNCDSVGNPTSTGTQLTQIGICGGTTTSTTTTTTTTAPTTSTTTTTTTTAPTTSTTTTTTTQLCECYTLTNTDSVDISISFYDCGGSIINPECNVCPVDSTIYLCIQSGRGNDITVSYGTNCAGGGTPSYVFTALGTNCTTAGNCL